MTSKERADVGNKLYEAIFPTLAKYETRGFNAHQRAQAISENVLNEMDRWITKQQPERKVKPCKGEHDVDHPYCYDPRDHYRCRTCYSLLKYENGKFITVEEPS